MKSPSFCVDFPDENRLLRFSFSPSFRRLAFSCSSASTFAVSDAVAAFLIPPLGVMVPSGFGATFKCFSVFRVAVSAEFNKFVSVASAFFRFLPEPAAFFSECVSPSSLSFCARMTRRSISAATIGRILMTLSGVYDSLHYKPSAILRHM